MLEREGEHATLAALVEGASRGEGAVAMVQGDAGIGKTALLHRARELAVAAGLRPLAAVGSELEREYPFGLLHQLLDPVLADAGDDGRERLLQGAARAAAPVLAPSRFDEPRPAAPDYAVLHGLYWLTVDLAEQTPLVLLVDDLHWADAASLRFLEFLCRRLDGLPVLVVGAMRPNEPGAEQAILEALSSGPHARITRPAPLSDAAVADVLAAVFDTTPAPPFVAACAAATGGNPLLVHALAREAASAGLRGGADDAEEAARLGAAGVAPLVRRRLRALGDDAVRVAHAAAVLGDRRDAHDLVHVAQISPEATSAAIDRLVAANVFDGDGRAFAHPLLRQAIMSQLLPAQRALLHGRVARRLRERGARDDEIAVHLLATEPAGDGAAVETLRRAAWRATAEGATDIAIVHLRRALAEPPFAHERGEILLELGELEVRTGHPQAVDTLDAALREGLDGDAAARAWASRGVRALFVDPNAAIDEIERAAAGASDPVLRAQLQALVLESSTYARGTRREELLASGRAADDAGAASEVMLAHLAYESGYGGGAASVTEELARRALHGGGLLRLLGPDSSTINLLAHALRYAERPEMVARVVDEADADVRRTGMTLGALFVDHVRAYQQLSFGSVAAGLAHGQTGLEKAGHAGWPVSEQAFAAVVVELLLELDRVDDAADVIERFAAGTFADDVIVGPFLLAAHGAVRAEQGHADEAQRLLRRVVHLLDERGWRAPLVTAGRLRLARLLARSGQRDEAVELAEQAVVVARAAGTGGALGASLCVRGVVVGGAEGLADLTAGVAALERSPLPLERGWALHDLGSALRREGRNVDARDPLRRALVLAEQAEAARLKRCVLDELTRTGARPQRIARQGPESLTPAERRVCDLAASGRSNREIAQELWVTRKTVEMHLSNAYAKLGIRSRVQLAGSLPGR